MSGTKLSTSQAKRVTKGVFAKNITPRPNNGAFEIAGAAPLSLPSLSLPHRTPLPSSLRLPVAPPPNNIRISRAFASRSSSSRDQINMLTELVQFLFFGRGLFLLALLSTMDFEDIFTRPAPKDVQQDIQGGALVLVSFFGPIIVYNTAPKERSVKLIDDH